MTRPDTTDPIAPVHKALRRFMFDTLVRIGALDVGDRLDVERSVNLVQRLLGVLDDPAPAIQATLAALRHGPASERRSEAAQLYRELSALVTARLQRLEAVESEPAPRLQGTALQAWRRAQLAGMDDAEWQDALHWMSGSLSPAELADLLDDLHAGAPARLDTTAATLRQRLDPARWAGVQRALGTRTLPLAA